MYLYQLRWPNKKQKYRKTKWQNDSKTRRTDRTKEGKTHWQKSKIERHQWLLRRIDKRQKEKEEEWQGDRLITRQKIGGGGGAGGGVIKMFWSIELNDLWSKKICRYTQDDCWNPVLHSSLDDLVLILSFSYLPVVDVRSHRAFFFSCSIRPEKRLVKLPLISWDKSGKGCTFLGGVG